MLFFAPFWGKKFFPWVSGFHQFEHLMKLLPISPLPTDSRKASSTLAIIKTEIIKPLPPSNQFILRKNCHMTLISLTDDKSHCNWLDTLKFLGIRPLFGKYQLSLTRLSSVTFETTPIFCRIFLIITCSWRATRLYSQNKFLKQKWYFYKSKFYNTSETLKKNLKTLLLVLYELFGWMDNWIIT